MFYLFYIAAFVAIFVIYFGAELAVYVFIPLILLYLFINEWKRYSKLNFLLRKESTLLELVPGSTLTTRDIELLLRTLHAPKKNVSFFEKNIKGIIDDPISIEIINHKGHTHFYIRTTDPEDVKEKLRGYSPESKLISVDDYSRKIPKRGVAVEFKNYPQSMSDLLTRGDTTWSQFILRPKGDLFECGIRVIYFPQDSKQIYNRKLFSSYKDRDYFVQHNEGFRISPEELALLFKL